MPANANCPVQGHKTEVAVALKQADGSVIGPPCLFTAFSSDRFCLHACYSVYGVFWSTDNLMCIPANKHIAGITDMQTHFVIPRMFVSTNIYRVMHGSKTHHLTLFLGLSSPLSFHPTFIPDDSNLSAKVEMEFKRPEALSVTKPTASYDRRELEAPTPTWQINCWPYPFMTHCLFGVQARLIWTPI